MVRVSATKQMGEQKKQYALVRWVSGIYKDELTHDVPVEWVQDLDVHGDFTTESHIVEWRVPPKPADGWLLFNGEILAVGDDLRHLEKLMEKEVEKEASGSKKSGTISVRSSESRTQHTLEHSSNVNGKNEPAVDLNSNMQALFGQLMAAISPGCSNQGKSSPYSPQQKRQGICTPVPINDDQVKIGKSLVISSSCLMEAKAAKSGTEMTVILVRGAFSTKRLRRCSYAGQKRTVNGEIRQKPSLKKYTKMRDIRTFVLSRFPDLSQSNFGAAINGLTGKKAVKKRQPETVEESEESESEME